MQKRQLKNLLSQRKWLLTGLHLCRWKLARPILVVFDGAPRHRQTFINWMRQRQLCPYGWHNLPGGPPTTTTTIELSSTSTSTHIWQGVSGMQAMMALTGICAGRFVSWRLWNIDKMTLKLTNWCV
jgi:hypothetical protein